MDEKKRDLRTIHQRAYPVTDYVADRLVKYRNAAGFKNYETTFEHLLTLGEHELKVIERRKNGHGI